MFGTVYKLSTFISYLESCAKVFGITSTFASVGFTRFDQGHNLLAVILLFCHVLHSLCATTYIYFLVLKIVLECLVQFVLLLMSSKQHIKAGKK